MLAVRRWLHNWSIHQLYFWSGGAAEWHWGSVTVGHCSVGSNSTKININWCTLIEELWVYIGSTPWERVHQIPNGWALPYQVSVVLALPSGNTTLLDQDCVCATSGVAFTVCGRWGTHLFWDLLWNSWRGLGHNCWGREWYARYNSEPLFGYSTPRQTRLNTVNFYKLLN